MTTDVNGNIHTVPGAPTGGEFARKPLAEATNVVLERIVDEGAALAELVEDEFESASDKLDEARAVMVAARATGTRDEQAMFGLLLASAADDLDIATRRRDAVLLAVRQGAVEEYPQRSEFVCPSTLTELRKAASGIKAGRIRGLIIRSDATAKLDYKGIEIAAPKGGLPVFVEVHSGFAGLKVTRGTVVVDADSVFGNSVTVSPGATAVVLAGEGRKVSTTTEGTGVMVLVGAEGARGLQSQSGTGGHLDIIDAGDLHTSRYAK